MMGNSNIPAPEWLFFDVGSTLINEEKAYMHRLQDIADAAGEPVGKIYDQALDLFRKNRKGDLEVMKSYGLPLLRWHTEDEELYPDAVSCLEKLSSVYKIGIIANQSLGTAERLQQHGILKYIDVVAASAEEGISKPDRRLFSIALSKAGCKAADAVMIGDRIDNDIVPAKSLGMKTVRIKQGVWSVCTSENEGEQADYEVKDLSEVTELLMPHTGQEICTI